ncbi:hypothetical protein CEC48_25500 [Pseudomonas sp. K2I15]|nr:hypothetical protein CEC48_25500 [Pseudomonas sp. K2I15]
MGAGLLAKVVNDNACFLDERGALRFFASKPAPTEKQLCFCSGFSHSGRLSGRRAFAFDLDLTAPFSPRPNAGIAERVNRQDAGLAAPGHGWPVAAARFAVPERGNAEPKRGADRRGRAFWLLCRFCKVTRCKSETIGRRYLNNGYVPHQALLLSHCMKPFFTGTAGASCVKL